MRVLYHLAEVRIHLDLQEASSSSQDWRANYARRKRGQVMTYRTEDWMMSREPDSKQIIAKVVEVVCEHYGVTLASLKGPSKRYVWAWPRQVAMWLCIDSGANRIDTAEYLGRDPTDVSTMVRKVREARDCFPRIRARLDELKRKVMVNE